MVDSIADESFFYDAAEASSFDDAERDSPSNAAADEVDRRWSMDFNEDALPMFVDGVTIDYSKSKG